MSPNRARAALLSLLLMALALGGCASGGGQDAGPRRERPDLAEQPDPEPRWEPAAGAGNRSPYVVFGKTYHVMPSARGFVDEGEASWYGRKFHGRNTSNGERYDMFALTAAHKHLPLPTWVRVTNLANGRETIVRVNDRGPFHGDRIIDLSYGAAVKLGFADAGVTRVRIEAITPPRPGAPTEPAPMVAAPTPAPPAEDDAQGGDWWLQAGAFGDADAAAGVREALAALLGPDASRIRLEPGDAGITRVRIGPFDDLAEADRLQALITFADLVGVPLLVRDP